MRTTRRCKKKRQKIQKMIAKKNKIKNKTKEIIKSGENGPKQSWFFSPMAKRMYIFVLTLAVVVVMLAYDFTPNINIEAGRPAPRTIKANRNLEFEDPAITEENMLRNEAAVEDAYAYDADALTGENGTLYSIRYFFNLAGIVQKKTERTFEEKVDYLNNLTGNRYPASVISIALRLSVEERELLNTRTQDIAREVMRQAIRPNELDLARQQAADMARDDDIPPDYIPLAISVLEQNIQPTAVFNPEATQRARLEARMDTPPAMVTILEGQTIVYEGEIVSSEDIAILQRLGLMERDFNWKRFLYILFIAFTALYLFGFYIQKFNRNVYDNIKKLLLISIILVIFTGIIKVLTVLSSIHLPLWNYLFPVIAAAMLCTIIFDSRLAIMLAISMSAFLGIATDFDFSITVAYLLGAIFSTYLVSNISQRSTVMRAGFISSLMLGFLFLTVNLIGGELQNIALYTMLGVLNGIICAILTIGLLPFIESTFNIVTAMGLLELSHTDQPLLKELLISSPGTYNHSLLVGHLAENAAKAIGADALLVKVAALYHDLGKMKRPEYFYENQADIQNIHDRLNPSMSRNIIANHIKDGVEVAIKNKIPKKVIEIISQHHGNSVISYFYEKQKGMDAIKTANGSGNGLKGHFRYPSKKPQTREAAVLMLADSTEAAIRSIDKMTPKKIEQMVSDIVEDKINDGQLSEANITLKEIEKVKNSLIDGLISIHHSRITYPEPAKESVEARK
ncbi:MAG: HD family phosphohydrolase [Actinomycetota bacterium]